nr:MAG TPA: hypothetical protein [Caudoviricetes sp.]
MLVATGTTVRMRVCCTSMRTTLRRIRTRTFPRVYLATQLSLRRLFLTPW